MDHVELLRGVLACIPTMGLAMRLTRTKGKRIGCGRGEREAQKEEGRRGVSLSRRLTKGEQLELKGNIEFITQGSRRKQSFTRTLK